MFWHWLLIGNLAIGNLLCLGVIVLGLPGAWLMLGLSALVDHFTARDLFEPSTFFIGLGIAVVGELLEFFMGSVAAKKAGAGRAASLGALFGGIGGALLGTFMIPIPVVGSLAGAALGAFGLSAYLEYRAGRDPLGALRVGRGAATGQVTGMLLKLVAGVSLWVHLTIASIW